ncbi:MAG: hypothetical protein AAB289_09785, partial [Chloroflexota bacterium]
MPALEYLITVLVFFLVTMTVMAVLTPNKVAIRARLNNYAGVNPATGFEANLSVPLFDRLLLPM